MSSAAASAIASIKERHRYTWYEVLPWVVAVSAYFLLPTSLNFGARILVMVLFALSLNLAMGYAGILTLGHAVFFGLGAYFTGILAARELVTDPLIGLLGAIVVGALAGLISGVVILRTRTLTLLMLTIALLFLVHEVANKATFLTGGADGLAFTNSSLFGWFEFDLFGRTSYLYNLIVLAIGFFLIRHLVHSPFGRSLVGIHENPDRMTAFGAPVHRKLVAAYTLSAAVAGAAGALSAQATQVVSLQSLSFDLSATVLLMLIFGGIGRLYGAFIGVPVFMILNEYLAAINPAYWQFWMGCLLILLVMFAPGGILGVVDRLWPQRTKQVET